MKETKINFEETVPVKETVINFDDTISLPAEKPPKRLPKKEPTWWDSYVVKSASDLGREVKSGLEKVVPSTVQWYKGWELSNQEKSHKQVVENAILNDKIERKKNKLPSRSEGYYKSKEFLNTISSTPGNLSKQTSKDIKKTNEQMLGIDKKNKIDQSMFKGYVSGAIQSAAQAVPAITATALTKSPAPLLTLTGVSSYGSSYANARSQGVDPERAHLASLGAGAADVAVGAIQTKWLLNPGKSLIKELTKQGVGGVALDELSEVTKMAIEKKLITPDMTFNEMKDRLARAGFSSLLTNTVQGAISYKLIAAPKYKVNHAAEAARDTLESLGETEVKQKTLVEPKPLSENELEEVYNGNKEVQNKEEELTIPRPKEAPKGTIEDSIQDDPSLSKFYTNTVKKTSELTNEVKTSLIPENFKKNVESSEDWLNSAKKAVDEDVNKVIEDVKSKEAFSGGEDSAKSALAVKKLAEEAQASGDYAKLNEFAAVHAEKLGNTARALKAADVSWDKLKTPEEVLVKAHQEFNKMKEKVLEKNPDTPEDKLPKINADLAKRIVDTMESVKGLPDRHPDRLTALYTVRQILAQKANLLAKGKIAQVLLEYSNTNLLASPTSIGFVNPLGNTIRIGTDLLKAYGYGVGDLIAKGSPQMWKEANARVSGEFAALKHVLTNLDPRGKDLVGALQEIAKDPRMIDQYMGISSLAGDESISNELGSHLPALSSDFLKNPEASLTIPWRILDYIGVGMRTVSVHALQVGDNLAEQINYFGEARAEVSRRAHDSGLVGKQRSLYENKLYQDVIDYLDGKEQLDLPKKQYELVKEIHEHAVFQAKEATWKGKMPEVLEQTTNVINKHPMIKLLAARFFRTPVNIMKWGITDNSPLSLLSKSVRNDLQGKNGYNKQVKAVVNTIFGTMLWSGFAGLVATHRVTGQHAPNERRAKLAAGIPEFSIELGEGNWFNYRRWEPLATPLSLVASYHGISEYLEDEDKENYASIMALALGHGIYSSSMLKQTGDLLRMLDSGYRLQDKNVFEQYATNQVAAYLPLSGLPRGIKRGATGELAKDPYLREAKDVMDKIKETYAPHLLNPKLNTITGQPVENHGEHLGMTIGETDWDNPGIVKIAQLGMNITPPSDKVLGVKLDKQQYWEYQRSVNTQFHLSEILNKVATQPGFEDIPKETQKTVLRDLITSIRTQAGLAYLQSQGLLDKVIESKQKEASKLLQPTNEQNWSKNAKNDWFK